MKFSYTLIKKLVPAIRSKNELIEKLNFHFFEAGDIGGDTLDISIPPNRFSDAASHWGIAREISAILGIKSRIPRGSEIKPRISRGSAFFKVEIKDKELCPRYTAQYFENVTIKSSPKWMQKILLDCGLRPINNVVDIMNYVMLETGQPLHAFDYDKLTTNNQQPTTIIIVRRANKGEKITTLDDITYELDENILVIADSSRESAILALAGIKGGKKAEVDENTKRIIVESANFDGANIYKSSKILKLTTDASLRFSHNLSPELTIIGINRAGQLLQEIAGAKSGSLVDVNFTKSSKKIIKFDINHFNKFTGLDLDTKTCQKYLQLLGFKITQTNADYTQTNAEINKAQTNADYTQTNAEKSQRESAFSQREFASSQRESVFLVEVPPLRQDVENFSDLVEEVIRLYGYNQLKSIPPRIYLHPSGFEDQIILRDKIKKVLVAAGLSEVYNYSFIGDADLRGLNADPRGKSQHQSELSPCQSVLIELENPISNQFKYLRPSLSPHLIRNINSNFRFFEEVKIFEIGHVFTQKRGAHADLITRIARGSSPRESMSGLRKSAFSPCESAFLGIALASKKKKGGTSLPGEHVFFELKGLLEELFKKIGLVSYLMPEPKEGDWVKTFTDNFLIPGEVLKIESDGEVIGYLGRVDKELVENYEAALAEINLDALLKLVEEEHEYLPLPKYPSVMRDISILVEPTTRVGEIMQAIQLMTRIPRESKIKRGSLADQYQPAFIEDVDLIDEYEYQSKRSLTFRIVFQAEDRTLTEKEVNEEMERIIKMLKNKFKAIIR
jgi:phenylalanyl-tRNA synthetase beta chain